MREIFDQHLELVLEQMPQAVTQLLDEVPLLVEDHPSDRIIAETGIRHRNDLCGLYTGIPLSDRSIMHSGVLSDVVTIYREGILRASEGLDGSIPGKILREEIRITIMHELGHHFGMNEDELAELGYG